MRRTRWAFGLVAVSVAVVATAACVPPPPAGPTATLIGDSTMAAMVWYDDTGASHSQSIIRASYNLQLEAESCRRLTAPSCRGRFGYTPSNTMDVLRSYSGRLGDAVVIMAGYDDVSIGDAVNQIMAETNAQGVKHVIWLNYPTNVPYVLPGGFPAGQLYPGHNVALFFASLVHPTLHVVDWDTMSHANPGWMGRDGIHLTPAGAEGLARVVKAELDRYIVPPPPPPTQAPTTQAPTTQPAATDPTTTTSTTTTTTLAPTTSVAETTTTAT